MACARTVQASCQAKSWPARGEPGVLQRSHRTCGMGRCLQRLRFWFTLLWICLSLSLVGSHLVARTHCLVYIHAQTYHICVQADDDDYCHCHQRISVTTLRQVRTCNIQKADSAGRGCLNLLLFIGGPSLPFNASVGEGIPF